MKALFRASLFLLMSAMSSVLLHAQWMQTNGPFGAPVWAVSVNGSTLFAATDYGISASADSGDTWTTVKLPKIIKSLGALGGTVFAGASGGVYRSTDNGMTWTFATNKGINAVVVTAITSLGRYLYAGNMYGVSRSSDNGESWTLVNSGAVTGLTIMGSTIFQSVNGTYGGVFRSNDSGATWVKTSSSINDSDVWSIASGGSTAYAGCGNGEVFQSTDNGTSWTPMKTGLVDTVITSIALNGSTIYAGTRGAGIYKTADNGAHWTRDLPGLTEQYVNSIVSTGSAVIAGTYAGAFRIAGGNSGWMEVNNGLVMRTVNALAANTAGTTLFAACEGGGVSRSTDAGATWSSPNIGLKKYNGPTASAYAVAVKGSLVFAGTDGDNALYKSIDDGITWLGSGTGLPNRNVATLFVSGSTIFAGMYGGEVYRSLDNGATWTKSDAGLPAVATVNAFALIGQVLFAAPFANGVYMSTDNGVTWTAAKTGIPVSGVVRSLGVGMDSTGKATIVAGMESDAVFRSTDNGATWTSAGSGLPQHATVNALVRVGTMLFAGTESDSMFVSFNNGTTWIRANQGLAAKTVNALLVIQDAYGNANLYAGTGSNGVYRYTGNISLRPVIAVSKPSPVSVGTPFWLEVKVGDRAPVSGLYGISFKLRSDKATCTYVDGSAALGGFPDPGVLTYFKLANSQTLDVAVSNTAPPGMNGSGILVKAQYTSTVGGNIRFTIEDLTAIDQNGVQIPLDTAGLIISLGGPVARPVGIGPYQLGKPFWVQVQIGGPDTVKNLYGVSFKLRSDRSTCTYVDGSATSGTLLGSNPLTLFRKVDAQTVDMAVTKIAAPGVTGNGIVAKGQFISATTEAVTFSLTDVIAIDQSGAAILLGAEPLSISTIVTDVDNLNIVPAEVRLHQNYPNPFNPATAISFSLPKRSFASLKVFDVLGREIETLISQELEAGSFSVHWQPNVPSGTYLYQLRVGERIETKRMVLLK